MKKITFWLGLAVLLPLVTFYYHTQGAAMTNLNTTASGVELTSQDLAALADELFAAQMGENHIPGAALVVVRGDEVLLAEGYGTADLADGTRVTSETAFRVGSISKLFTATVVMQLVEQGKIDLNADVNIYLKRFQLETRFPGPVTTAQLLTHTAGFDEHYIGGHARSAAEGQSLGDYLADHMPPQTAPSGEFISYNDHTMALAGFLVEEVSGMPFAAYVQQYVTGPLGMDATTFQQPAPDAILEKLAVGYEYRGGEQKPFQYDYINVGPSAALLTTAGDMAAFLRAHLNGGGGILAPETLAEMHTTQFRHDVRLRGRAYGFSELFINGERVLFHDGGNPGFINRLVLVPERGIGFFITANTDQNSPGMRFNRDFTTAFFDRYLPESTAVTPPEAAPGVVVDPPRYTGYYREMQAYSHFTIQKLLSLMQQFPVKANDAGQVVVGSTALVPQEQDVFQWSNDPNYVVFREDASGKVSHMFFGTGAFVRLKWYESQPFHLALLGIFLLTFLSAVVVSLLPGAAPAGGQARAVLGLMGGLNLVFLVGLGLALTQTSQWEFAYGLNTTLKVLLVIPFLAIVLTAGVVVFGFQGWAAGTWPVWLRVYYTLAALVGAGYVPFLYYWNLLGWRV